MLVALVSAQRSQTLHMLNINFMKDTSSCFEFVLPAHVKQSRPGYQPPSVMLHAYPYDKSLCVYSYLTEYLKRTQPLRGKETQLFLSFTRPHKAISKETLSRWIRTVMSSAGIDVASFKPHSTRSASTSKAKAALFQWTRFCARQGGPRLDLLIDSTINQSNPQPFHQQYYILSNF